MSSLALDKDGKPALATLGPGILQKPFQATDLFAAVDAKLPHPVVTLLQNWSEGKT